MLWRMQLQQGDKDARKVACIRILQEEERQRENVARGQELAQASPTLNVVLAKSALARELGG